MTLMLVYDGGDRNDENDSALIIPVFHVGPRVLKQRFHQEVHFGT